MMVPQPEVGNRHITDEADSAIIALNNQLYKLEQALTELEVTTLDTLTIIDRLAIGQPTGW